VQEVWIKQNATTCYGVSLKIIPVWSRPNVARVEAAKSRGRDGAVVDAIRSSAGVVRTKNLDLRGIALLQIPEVSGRKKRRSLERQSRRR